jgi:hypothetical protein
MAIVRSDEASIYNCCSGGNNWLSCHSTSRAAASNLRGLLGTFLTGELPQLLEDVPLTTQQTMLFKHDGVPANVTRDVKQFLDSHYPYRWVVRNATVLWPPRSPDLTPANFYLWGHLKNTVYWKRVKTLDELWRLIQAAVATIWRMTGIFQRTRNSWHHRYAFKLV